MLDKKKLFLSSKLEFTDQKKNIEIYSAQTTRTTLKQTDQQEPKQNIFNQLNDPERLKYNDYNNGPKYDSNGLLITWSILGKPDQFQRVKNNTPPIRENKKKRTTIALQAVNALNPSSKKNIFKMKSIYQDQDQSFTSIRKDNRTRTLSPDKQKTLTHKKIKNKQNLVSKSQLLEYMKQIQFKLDQNDQKQDAQTQKLNINLRNIATREKKILEQSESNREIWEHKKCELAAYTKREPQNTLFSRSQEFRLKIENAITIEASKNGFDKFNQRFWYLGLRKKQGKVLSLHEKPFTFLPTRKQVKQNDCMILWQSSQHSHRISNRDIREIRKIGDDKEEQNQEHILSDLTSGFTTKVFYNPRKEIEVVRNPNLQQYERNKLFSRQFRKNFDRKINEVSSKLKNQFTQIQEQEIQKLQIEGESVYYKELKQLKEDGENENALYEKINIENELKKNEVIEEKWDKNELGQKGILQYVEWLQNKK